MAAHSPHVINRRARFDYTIIETWEAGIVLTGSEVKSIRLGKAGINEAFAIQRSEELFLINATIAPYPGANRFNHAEKRPRKLLLHRREIVKILGGLTRERLTLVPLELYFNDKGKAKILLGLGKGKRLIDKRATIKEREWNRRKQAGLKNV